MHLNQNGSHQSRSAGFWNSGNLGEWKREPAKMRLTADHIKQGILWPRSSLPLLKVDRKDSIRNESPASHNVRYHEADDGATAP